MPTPSSLVFFSFSSAPPPSSKKKKGQDNIYKFYFTYKCPNAREFFIWIPVNEICNTLLGIHIQTEE